MLQQGDVSDATEPYLKARDLDKRSLEKFKGAASFFCKQLGKYRMPLAWTAINVLDILAGNQVGVCVCVFVWGVCVWVWGCGLFRYNYMYVLLHAFRAIELQPSILTLAIRHLCIF